MPALLCFTQQRRCKPGLMFFQAVPVQTWKVLLTGSRQCLCHAAQELQLFQEEMLCLLAGTSVVMNGAGLTISAPKFPH